VLSDINNLKQSNLSLATPNLEIQQSSLNYSLILRTLKFYHSDKFPSDVSSVSHLITLPKTLSVVCDGPDVPKPQENSQEKFLSFSNSEVYFVSWA
jgi:hypothetical protein